NSSVLNGQTLPRGLAGCELILGDANLNQMPQALEGCLLFPGQARRKVSDVSPSFQYPPSQQGCSDGNHALMMCRRELAVSDKPINENTTQVDGVAIRQPVLPTGS